MVRLCPCLEVSVNWYLVVVLFSRDGPFVSPAWRFLLIGRRFSGDGPFVSPGCGNQLIP